MRKVEQPAGHEQRRARGCYIAEPDGAQRERPIRGERQVRLGKAEDLDPLGERLGREAERAAVLVALVARIVTRGAPAAPGPCLQAGQLRAGDRVLGLVAGLCAEHVVGAQMQHARRGVGHGPDGLCHPAPRAVGGRNDGRIDPLLHEGAQGGLVEHTGFASLEALVPEAQALLQEADRRTGLARVRIEVAPRPDEALRGPVVAVQQAEHGVVYASCQPPTM